MKFSPCLSPDATRLAVFDEQGTGGRLEIYDGIIAAP
jgi:hypothetical protein